jgi:ABC-type lipopolysaccharide export system ATPase subunit
MSDRAYLIETGRVVASGKSADLLASDYVKAAYLGAA